MVIQCTVAKIKEYPENQPRVGTVDDYISLIRVYADTLGNLLYVIPESVLVRIEEVLSVAQIL